MNRTQRVLCLLFCVFAALGVRANAADEAYRIVKVDGPWLVDGTLVHRGDSAREGAHVELYAGTSGGARRRASIGMISADATCSAAKPCSKPWTCLGTAACASGATLPPAVPMPPGLLAITKLGALAHPQPRLEFDMERAVTVERLVDAVVQRDGDRLDLTPVLAVVRPGSYCLLVTRLADNKLVSDSTISTPGTEPLVVNVHGAGDELYEADLLTSDGRPLADTALLLAATPPRDVARRLAYANAFAMTDAWPHDAANDVLRHDFLRSVLEALAEPNAVATP
jgi:hypothetical protein